MPRQDKIANSTGAHFSNSPTPALGELLRDNDTGYLYLGNGVTPWVDLLPLAIPYQGSKANPRLPDQVSTATLMGRPIDPATSTPGSITALSSVINGASGGGEISLRPGVYAWDDSADLANGTHLKGGPGVVFEWDDTTSANYPLLIQGTESAHTLFGANQVAGSYTVTLPAGAGASFAVDDVIGFISPAIVAGANGRARELHQVLGVSGDTITLDAPLYFSYNTADAAAFFKQTPKKDITISGITFRWNAAEPVKWRGPIIQRALRCHFKDITVVNGPGITLGDAINCSATNITVDGSKEYNTIYLPGSYGVTVSGSGHGVVVNGGTFRAARHAVTTLYHQVGADLYTGPFGTVFANLVGWGGTESFSVFDTHSHAFDTVFNACIAYGPGGGSIAAFQDRGTRTLFTACKSYGSNRGFVATTDSAFCHAANCEVWALVGASSIGMALSGPNGKIFGGRISGGVVGVSLSNTGTNALVEGVEFLAAGGTSCIHDQSTADVGQRSVRNTFRMSGGGQQAMLGWRGVSVDDEFVGTNAAASFLSPGATGRRRHRLQEPTTVAYAAAITPAPAWIDSLSITLTGNITINNVASNQRITGQRVRFIFIQDATGGRTVTWDTDYKLPASAVFDTTLSTITMVTFEYSGTFWRMTDFVTAIPA